MLTAILPLITVSLGLSAPAPERGEAAPPVTITQPRSAQVHLAVTLSEADAIHAVGQRGRAIVFAIDRDGEAFEVVATVRTNGANKGEVIGLSITDVGTAICDMGSLSWLGGELAGATAVTVLAVDGDGAVTITTNDGRTYMAIPGRGSGGNAGASARWAAAWDREEG